MYDFADIAGMAGTSQEQGGTPRQQLIRLGLFLIAAYCMAAFFCWEELSFRKAIEVPATMSVVSHQHDGKSTVRYLFREPETGKAHQNTVQIRTAHIPTDHNVTVQYIASTNSSRLATQARPWMAHTFFYVNLAIGLVVLSSIGYLSWESTQRMPTRQQRALAAYHKRKQNEKYQRRAVLQ